jgi:serine/threonine protein phosphatase PrpC
LKYRVEWWGATDAGRVRENNEDTWLVDDDLHTAILADGMGGENCGEIGSAVTIETVSEYIRSPQTKATTLEELAKGAIQEANRHVIQAGHERPECNGMGSTIVMALWRIPELLIANVGDSRAYLFRDGELSQLSYDQNFANELRTKLGLSEERVRSVPNGNVLTMAVGSHERILIQTRTEMLKPGDQVLLCSDGLHGPVENKTIARILAESETVRQKVERLIDCANSSGGPDNVTVIVLKYVGEGHG